MTSFVPAVDDRAIGDLRERLDRARLPEAEIRAFAGEVSG